MRKVIFVLSPEVMYMKCAEDRTRAVCVTGQRGRVLAYHVGGPGSIPGRGIGD